MPSKASVPAKLRFLDTVRIALNDLLRDAEPEVRADERWLEPVRRFRHEIEHEIEYQHTFAAMEEKMEEADSASAE